ncbi:MAG TPA: thioredoxin domain-containing protein [Candidatus Binataceae bacterium]|nr:thioredoxin domain-containing protein [Candidatus Binataceae bacterium]
MSHRKYLLASRLVRMIVLSAAVAGGAVMLAAGRADAASPAAAPAAIASNPARDQAVKLFLQRKFRIPTIEEIKLGPLERTGIPGLYGRSVAVTNDKGQTASVVMFTNPEETKAIIGQFMDLNADPWGRTDMRMIHLEDRPTLGPADAQITIVEFADFECPFCAHAFSEIETLANTTYKGKIRVIYKNYPLNVHPWARTAALGAECARLQNPEAFWDFARYFYANQGQITAQNVQRRIDQETATLSLDDTVMNACMKGPQAAARVQQDQADAAAVKVSSTPTFFINGISVVGLPEGKVFNFVIDSELAKAAAQKAGAAK